MARSVRRNATELSEHLIINFGDQFVPSDTLDSAYVRQQ
jgi:hypothetical protein